MSEDVRYNAFISYRHCEPDKTIAKALHKKLENYRIPKELREKLSRNVLGRVFRDEAELPVTDSLSDAILDALRNSEYLIVICSPRLKDSEWCMKEIEIFTKLHGKKNILPVLIEGEPEDSFPESFFYEDVTEKDPEGNEVLVRIEKEPLAADARGGRRSLRDCVIKLSAAILKLNYDDLKQRHRLEQLKRRTFFSGIILGIILLFLFQSLYFISTIREQKNEIEKKYADSMAQNAAELFDLGYRMDALYAARSVLPDVKDDNISGDAFRALVKASEIYSKEYYVPVDMLTAPVLSDTSILAPGGKKIIVGNERINRYYILDIDSKNIYAAVNSNDKVFAFYKDEGLFYSNNGEIFYLSIDNNEVTALDDVTYCFQSPTGEEVICTTDEGFSIYRGKEAVYKISYDELGIDFKPEWYEMLTEFSEDGDQSLIRVRNYTDTGTTEWVILLDLKNGKAVNSVKAPVSGMVDAMAVNDKGISLLYSTFDAYGGFGDTYICNYDILNGKIIKEINMGTEYFGLMERYDDELIIGTEDRMVVYDTDLNYLSGFGISEYPLKVFRFEGNIVVVDADGEIYALSDDQIGYELTKDVFGDKEKNRVISFDYCNGNIYMNYAKTDGVAIYRRSEGIAFSETEPLDEEEVFSEVIEDVTIKDAFKSLDDFDMFMYDHGIMSEDGAYYAITMLDGSVHIYDSESLEEVRVFYGFGGYTSQFTYLEEIDCYAMVNGNMELFDRNFQHIASIDGIWYIEEDQGKIIVMRNDFKYYTVRLFSYEEILEYADNILGDYVPSGRMREKYGL